MKLCHNQHTCTQTVAMGHPPSFASSSDPPSQQFMHAAAFSTITMHVFDLSICAGLLHASTLFSIFSVQIRNKVLEFLQSLQQLKTAISYMQTYVSKHQDLLSLAWQNGRSCTTSAGACSKQLLQLHKTTCDFDQCTHVCWFGLV